MIDRHRGRRENTVQKECMVNRIEIRVKTHPRNRSRNTKGKLMTVQRRNVLGG